MNWTPIEGFPKYSVNRLGQVRHDRLRRLVVPYENQRGAVYVVLQRHGRNVARSLPLLVARAFVPNKKEAFDTVINLNGDRYNCTVDNLMWRPRWFAIQYNRQFKERYDWSVDTPVKDLATGEVFSTSIEAAIRYGLLDRDIVLSIVNRTYTWPTYQQFDFSE